MGPKVNKVLIILFLTGLVSGSELEWKAEFRYRLETSKNELLFSGSPRPLNYTRSRISLRFNKGLVTGFAQLQDSRVLGHPNNQAGLTKSSNQKIEFHQIYFQVNQLLKQNWTMEFGRFEMPLGSKRLFSDNQWNNNGRSFEGIHSYNQNKFGSLHTFYLINLENATDSTLNENDVLPRTTSEIIQGIYFTPSIKNLPFRFITQLNGYIYRDESKSVTPVEPINHSTTTMGYRFSLKIFFLQLENEMAIQKGNANMSSSLKHINSRMEILNIRADLSRLPIIENITFGKEYLSGNNVATDNLDGFANPWGEDHKYHGYFDRFYLFNDHSQPGLDEWNIKMEFSFPGQTMVNIHYHDFKDGVKSNPLGTELDIVSSINLGFGGVLQQGFSRYWEADGSSLDYSWFMLTFIL